MSHSFNLLMPFGRFPYLSFGGNRKFMPAEVRFNDTHVLGYYEGFSEFFRRNTAAFDHHFRCLLQTLDRTEIYLELAKDVTDLKDYRAVFGGLGKELTKAKTSVTGLGFHLPPPRTQCRDYHSRMESMASRIPEIRDIPVCKAVVKAS